MNLIAAADLNWAIGNKGRLLARVKADLGHFARLTENKTVIYGSKTLLTFPGGKPLKNRFNIVLSRKADFFREGAVTVHSLRELEELVSRLNSDDLFVIGGESVYGLLLPRCRKAYITKFDKAFEADAHIPNLDLSPEWELLYEGEKMTSDAETDSEGNLGFRFTEDVRTDT